eukprot:167600-Pleurochrysis_carterae.AAC.1
MARHNIPTAYAMSGLRRVRHDPSSFRVQRVRADKREIRAGGRMHAVCIGGNVHVEQIRHWALVFDVPSRSQVGNERGVKGVGRVVGIEDEQVVDVATNDY